MERGVANVFAHIHRIGIAKHLGLGLLHGRFRLHVRGLALEVLQLDDVGMLHVGANMVAHHLVEGIVERIVRAYVEAAGEIVQRDGTNPGDEDTLEGGIGAGLDGIEEGTQIACAVRFPLVLG